MRPSAGLLYHGLALSPRKENVKSWGNLLQPSRLMRLGKMHPRTDGPVLNSPAEITQQQPQQDAALHECQRHEEGDVALENLDLLAPL
jgi:hypothetical protein